MTIGATTLVAATDKPQIHAAQPERGDERPAATPPSPVTLHAALRGAEDSLTQARADAWGAFDALAGSDPQAAVDLLIADLDRSISPLVAAVRRLGGDPRRCWPR